MAGKLQHPTRPFGHTSPPGVLRADPDAVAQHRAGSVRSAAIAARICSNSPRVTMTSAIWNVIDLLCRTILAPILTSRSRRVVNDHCLTPP